MTKKKTREDYKEAIDKLDLLDIKSSMKVLRYALNSYPDLFTYCVEKGMKTNKLTMKQVAGKCYLVCEYLPDIYKNDINFCSYIAKYNPRILKYCNSEFLEKDEIIRSALHNGVYYDTENPENNFRFNDIVSNLNPETLASSEYKEKVMKIFFEEVDNKKIDEYSMRPEYYYDTKWLMDITVFNVIIDNCVVKRKEHLYDLRYAIFFERYLKDNRNELATNDLILDRITELLVEVDTRLKPLLSIKPFAEIIDLVYSILMDKDRVEDMKSVVCLRDIDEKLALKFEKKFRLNCNLDYQLLIGNADNILQSLSNAYIETKQICYILKNYPIYYNNFEQFYNDYPEAKNRFSPEEITQNPELQDIVSNMPIDSFINFVNAISNREEKSKLFWFVTLEYSHVNVNSAFAIYNPKVRTDKSIALKIIREIENDELIYYYYWFLSEKLKLDEEIALAAIHRNHNIRNILRKKFLDNNKIIDEINNEKRNEEVKKEIEKLNKEEKLQAKIKQAHEILNKEYVNFIKEKNLPDYFQVDLFDLSNLSDIDVMIQVLEFLVVNDKSYSLITMNESLFQTKEFFKKLSKSIFASQIFNKISYKIDLEKVNIDPTKDINLINDLLNKDMLLPQCPASLIDSPEKAIHLINALENQICENTEWLPDEVILSVIDQYPENDELLLKYCKESFKKQLLMEHKKLSKNKNVMKKILMNENVQSSLFKSLDEINHSIYEDEDFLSFYCEKFSNNSKKVIFLPDLKNEELLNKYYYPLLRTLKDKLLLGSTLTKKYKKLLSEKRKNETTKDDSSEKNKDIDKENKIVFEIHLDDGKSMNNKFYVYGKTDKTKDILSDKLLVIKDHRNEIYIGKAIKVKIQEERYWSNSEIVQICELPLEFDDNVNKLKKYKEVYNDSKKELNDARGVLEYIEDGIKSLQKELDSFGFAFFGAKAKQKKSLIDDQEKLNESLKYYTKLIEALETKIKDLENEIQSSENYIHSFKKKIVEKINDNTLDFNNSECSIENTDYNHI